MELKVEMSYPEDRMRANRERMKAHAQFKYLDRIPVIIGISLRYILHERKVGYNEYFSSPHSQVYHQLMNRKWFLDNIDDDSVQSATVGVSPDFSTIRGAMFDVNVHWSDTEIPKTLPILHDINDIKHLEVPHPTNGLCGKKIEWYHQMKEIVKEAEVTFNNKSVQVHVGIGGEGGPLPIALSLAGKNLFLWAIESPDAVHDLMEKATQAFIDYENYIRTLTGSSKQGCSMGCDGGEMFSPKHFAEFVLPYYSKAYEEFPGHRGLHMCGKTDHLLDILCDEMEINSLDGFGDPVNRKLLAEKFGGRVYMSGGVNINLLLRGTKERIWADCMDALQILSPRGGYILQDGNNVPPYTPLENIRIMMECAEYYGIPIKSL